MPRHAISPPFVMLLTLLALSACSPPGGGERTVRAMTVNGEAFVMAKPDMAIVTVGVATQGTTAAQALAANNERMSALFKAISGLGIEDKDVQTSNFSVTPRYAPPDPEHPDAVTPGTIVGYDASNQVTVKVRDLRKLGDALDAFVATAGANNLQSVSFDFNDPTPIMDEARRKAVADARRKAALYAEGAGVKLGPIQSISEGGGYYPQPVYAMARAAEMKASVPVSPGESRISANVSLTYELQ
jgi:uncharacterized protein YggE